MLIKFSVNDLPPKKDGANSMWCKPTEIRRLKSLRVAALSALRGSIPDAQNVALTIRIYAAMSAGDLDNFITGICDGLMAAHPRTPIVDSSWADVPADVHPRQPIAYRDDAHIHRISAERLPVPSTGPKYEVELSW